MKQKIKIALCQMKVVPGRPDLNVATIEKEIMLAKKAGAEIIVFPEMCVPGYVIGDKYEDEDFVHDVDQCNKRILLASRGLDLTVIFGSLNYEPEATGEDGRTLKYNAFFVVRNGEILSWGEKTLQPNYRMFDDDRHFCSKRKLLESCNLARSNTSVIDSMFDVIDVPIATGSIKLGVIECEDMWHDDYPHNPTKILVEKGAELIINLSCSPWSWQKNRKRHSVVKNLLAECPVPFVYVNNTGVMNNGKNLIIFDGASTVYNRQGEIALEVEPFFAGTLVFDFTFDMPAISPSELDDTTQLFQALHHGVKEFLETMPPERRKIVIGLSGGIDSALAAAFYCNIVGPENVRLINMPSQYNSGLTKTIAAQIAYNLGCKYEVVPIQEVVDAIAKALGCNEYDAAYENIQARVRMEILAGKAQQLGGLFTNNGNKIENCFGYATLYGDVAGFLAAFGDLVKREVYQLADYLNRVVYGREIIPKSCFTIAPMAELKENQVDPFHYGNLEHRGYHDEMVRAFTEFRRNPEWFLENYLKGRLESELKLETGTLKSLFPRLDDFIADLESKWRQFHFAVMKRVQAPPIPILTKRAFGFDLRESMLTAHFTARYINLREHAGRSEVKIERIAIFGGSFNPPAPHHVELVDRLDMFDKVFIVPCGARPDKPSTDATSSIHRLAMCKLAFTENERVRLDLSDLEGNRYTPTYMLDARYKELYPEAEIWHVIGQDIVAGGSRGESEIERVWDKGTSIWRNLNFAVLSRSGFGAGEDDYPPHHMRINIDGVVGSSTLIRQRAKNNVAIHPFLTREIYEYIIKHDLYSK